jgi:TetR/AcrR family transcriptional regulator, mexJK operon transcriptional repressor
MEVLISCLIRFIMPDCRHEPRTQHPAAPPTGPPQPVERGPARCRRYGDKQALFRAALTRAIEDWIVPIDRLRAAECDDLEASLLAIGDILLTNIMSPAGLRLLRLTNSESGRSPEIGATNVQQGTEPTIAFLADLFQRRRGAALGPLDPREVAEGFLHLVTGPAIDAAWGVTRDEAALARHVHSSVRLFLHGLLGGEAGVDDGALAAENRLLREKLARIGAVLGEG